MSAAFTRPALRTAAVIGVGVGVTYASYRYLGGSSSPFVGAHTAHAEAPAAAGAATDGPKKVFGGKGAVELRLESAEMVNHNVKRLRFALPTADAVSGISPITSLLSQHTPADRWLPIPVLRPYTPVSDVDTAGYVEFMVKRYPNGRASGKMHSLVPGDTIKFRPLPEFDYRPNQADQVTMIVGGAGITPIYQLTRAILKNPADRTRITLVYANNTEDDVLLRAEFDDLEARFPDRFRAIYTVTRAPADSDPDTGTSRRYHTGYVTKDLLTTHANMPRGPDAPPAPGVSVFVSGPPPMIAAVAGKRGGFGWTQGPIGGVLAELGYTKEQVHKF